MELPECCYRVSVKALVLDESRQRFLVIREDTGVWELPGGGIEHGTELGEELKREIQEEMGIQVLEIEEQPSYVLTCKNSKGTPTLNVIYETSLADLNFTPSDECTELRFVTVDEARTLQTDENVQVFVGMFDPTLNMKQPG